MSYVISLVRHNSFCTYILLCLLFANLTRQIFPSSYKLSFNRNAFSNLELFKYALTHRYIQMHTLSQLTVIYRPYFKLNEIWQRQNRLMVVLHGLVYCHLNDDSQTHFTAHL